MTESVTTVRQDEYAALQEGVALQERPDAGVLRLTGADRADFLHRMTTNHINGLRPGQAAVTVLTSPTARILFVFTVICRQEDLLLLAAPHQASALARHLRGQIFFMDQVSVEDLSAGYLQLRLMGPAAGEILQNLGFTLSQAPEGQWQEVDGLLAVRQMAYDVPGFALAVPTDKGAEWVERLVQMGALRLEADAAYTARRVELGRPAPGHELVEAYNPLEAGLAWACAENKGCYTGQEIIARQITYDKVTKTLVGLRCQAPVAEGADILADGRAVGTVTTAAFSPTLGEPVALAVVRRSHNGAGTPVTVDGIEAEVASLPLIQPEGSGS
ncbi:aminomethyltransferase family protein [Litorilinea aerophila]|uniref:Aminomethyl transferase family protein n=1 Tax=Litorilinea aerophila TaxID=1204385 RepID=A0A540VIK2_9CHLR|nr:glycine cleavage T C-terminal barrel domain-containing protein [Litorilinea aerophila]MCC9075749.1 aminomethyltransferase family protein [Litorilinea aerophila]